MHNRLCSYLVNEKLLYSKQLGFQKGHSTEHTISQLADQIHESFGNENYTLRVLTLLTMQYYQKGLKIMELRVQIVPGSEVT